VEKRRREGGGGGDGGSTDAVALAPAALAPAAARLNRTNTPLHGEHDNIILENWRTSLGVKVMQ
jgi:hypothetical protein